jgi:hypothetical protein
MPTILGARLPSGVLKRTLAHKGVPFLDGRFAVRRELPVRRPTADQLLVRTGETVRKQR